RRRQRRGRSVEGDAPGRGRGQEHERDRRPDGEVQHRGVRRGQPLDARQHPQLLPAAERGADAPAGKMTVAALVDAHAGSRPRAPATHYDGAIVDWATLAERSRRVATALRELGIGAGDRVALYLPNTPAYLELYLALCRLGAIAVAVNTRFRSSEV